MNFIILIFATGTVIAGTIIVINPETVFGLLRRKVNSLGLHILAVVVRLVIVAALVMYAAESKYQTVILILGWISIVAACVFGIMGRTKFKGCGMDSIFIIFF
jgi:hypothetical protein